jgi:hypothetical protein
MSTMVRSKLLGADVDNISGLTVVLAHDQPVSNAGIDLQIERAGLDAERAARLAG